MDVSLHVFLFAKVMRSVSFEGSCCNMENVQIKKNTPHSSDVCRISQLPTVTFVNKERSLTNKNNSFQLAQNMLDVNFAREHYLFREANGFPRA